MNTAGFSGFRLDWTHLKRITLLIAALKNFTKWRGRFISARAKNTSSDATTAAAAAVHLHARGEHRNAKQHFAPPCGSSPSAKNFDNFLRVE